MNKKIQRYQINQLIDIIQKNLRLMILRICLRMEKNNIMKKKLNVLVVIIIMMLKDKFSQLSQIQNYSQFRSKWELKRRPYKN